MEELFLLFTSMCETFTAIHCTGVIQGSTKCGQRCGQRCGQSVDSSLLTPHSSLLTPHSSLLTPHSSLVVSEVTAIPKGVQLPTFHEEQSQFGLGASFHGHTQLQQHKNQETEHTTHLCRLVKSYHRSRLPQAEGLIGSSVKFYEEQSQFGEDVPVACH